VIFVSIHKVQQRRGSESRIQKAKMELSDL
jgi:hypothetical protein